MIVLLKYNQTKHKLLDRIIIRSLDGTVRIFDMRN